VCSEVKSFESVRRMVDVSRSIVTTPHWTVWCVSSNSAKFTIESFEIEYDLSSFHVIEFLNVMEYI
jgi:hypothetical protein